MSVRGDAIGADAQFIQLVAEGETDHIGHEGCRPTRPVECLQRVFDLFSIQLIISGKYFNLRAGVSSHLHISG